MDSTKSSAHAAHPPSEEEDGHEDTVEAHYASLERGIPCGCYGGYHYIGHEEGGEEHVEVVRCKRCKQA